MALHDRMAPDWIRLKKPDGHLGALLHPQRHILRFISKDGTVDYNLAMYIQELQAQKQEAEAK